MCVSLCGTHNAGDNHATPSHVANNEQHADGLNPDEERNTTPATTESTPATSPTTRSMRMSLRLSRTATRQRRGAQAVDRLERRRPACRDGGDNSVALVGAHDRGDDRIGVFDVTDLEHDVVGSGGDGIGVRDVANNEHDAVGHDANEKRKAVVA